MTERRLLIAALTWDVPSLVRSDADAAKVFLDCLSASPRLQPDEDDHPLNLAARAIRAARQGDETSFKAPIRALRNSDDPLRQTLGICLHWWLVGPPRRATAQADARRVVAQLRGAALRARTFAKLATYALDHHEHETSHVLLQEAKKIAPAKSELSRALSISILNEFGGRPTPADFQHGTPDDITHYEWIDSTALDAAQKDFALRLTDSARNPWSFTVRSGQTPLDSILAAELQATWAGALWKRRGIRQQVGAQLLLGGARNPDQAMYGVARWIQGGGRDIPQIVEFSESAFDSRTADALIHEVVGPPGKPIRHLEHVELAANLWDLMSEATVEELLTRIPVDLSDFGAPYRFFWSRAVLRAPRAWSKAVRSLSSRERVALAGHLPDEALAQLSKHDADLIRAEIEADEHAPERSRAVGIALSSRLNGPAVEVEVTPSLAIAVARLSPEALPADAYRSAELQLAVQLRETLDRARRGSFEMGLSLPLGITAVAAARGSIEPQSLALLKETARDAEAPGHIRVDSLIGLARMAHEGSLEPSQYRSLRTVPAQHGPQIFDPVSDSSLRASVLLLRAAMLSSPEQFELLALSRDGDARTRQLTASSAAIFLTHRRSTPAEAALLATLYDPDHTVVRNSLGVLGRHSLKLSRSIEKAVVDRLLTLFDSGPREVRRRVTAAAQGLSPARYSQLARILNDAEFDRSWLVRSELLSSKSR